MNVLKKALVFCAHPDDSYIFAHNMIQMLNRNAWLVTDLVATYKPESARGKEFRDAAQIMGAEPRYLGLDDNPYAELNIWGDTNAPAFIKDTKFLNGFDLIVTHNPSGEYGHPHHTQVHNWVMKNIDDTRKVLVFSQNYVLPDFQLHNPNKLKSKVRDVYEREAYMVNNFNLITEGFATLGPWDQLHQDLADMAIRYNMDTIGKGSI